MEDENPSAAPLDYLTSITPQATFIERHWKELKDQDAILESVEFYTAAAALDDAPLYAPYLDYLKYAVKACVIDLEHMHNCYAQVQRPHSSFLLPRRSASSVSLGALLGDNYTYEDHATMLINGARYITWKCLEFELLVRSSQPLEDPADVQDQGHSADLIL